MKIRKATEEEIPAMVEVLKASLGEGDLPLSPSIWRYKHTENPFGRSLVYVAEEDHQLVGIRAFMRWEWQKQETVFRALRAVDTATHPHYQGRGIFKNLTMNAIDSAIEGNNDFVFNTPNEQSRPGYLKMGWEKVGKVKTGIQPSMNSFWKLEKQQTEYQKQKFASELEIQLLCRDWNEIMKNENKLFTPKSENFLRWRYENCPLQKYNIVATTKFYIATYIKKRRRFKELRISECLYRSWETDFEEIQIIIRKLAKENGAQVITFSPQIFKGGFLSTKGHYGPVLTLRKLEIDQDSYCQFKNIEVWNNSLGDLELF